MGVYGKVSKLTNFTMDSRRVVRDGSDIAALLETKVISA